MKKTLVDIAVSVVLLMVVQAIVLAFGSEWPYDWLITGGFLAGRISAVINDAVWESKV